MKRSFFGVMPPQGRRGRGGRAARGGSRGRGRASAAAPGIPLGAYEVDATTRAGINKKKLMWRATTRAPLVMARNLRSIEAERWARRPSALVRAAGKRYASEWLVADAYDGNRDDFATGDMMPDETMEDDVGWRAGPIVKDLPAFRGPKPGPTVSTIEADSAAREIMSHLLSSEFKRLACKYTHDHIVAYRKKLRAAQKKWDTIEKAFDHGDLSWLGWDEETGDYDQAKFENVFDLWLAAKLKVAQLKPEIPAKALWGHFKPAPALYDASELDRFMTFHQFQFCNRHFAFAETPSEGSGDSDAPHGDADDDAAACNRPQQVSKPLQGGEAGDAGEEAGEEGRGDSEGESGDDEGGSNGGSEGEGDVFVDTHRRRRELTDKACADFGAFWNPHRHVGLDEGTRATKHWDKVRIRFKASVHSGSLVDMLIQ